MNNELIEKIARIIEFGGKADPDTEASLVSDAKEIITLVNSKDKARLDWLSNHNNLIGNVTLPKECVENNLGSLRDAIDAAMELDAKVIITSPLTMRLILY